MPQAAALASPPSAPALAAPQPAGLDIGRAAGDYQADISKITSNESQQLGKEEADFNKQGLQPPKLDMPPPPTAKSDNAQQQWGSAAMLMGALGSLLTRQPLNTAMNAAAGVLTAFHKGDQEAANSAFQTWKVSTDNAIKIADFQQKAYQEALSGLERREKMTMEEANMAERAATAQFRATASAFQDEVALKALEQRGIQGAQELQIQRSRLSMETQEFAQKNYAGFLAMQGLAEWKKQNPTADPLAIAHKYSELMADPSLIKQKGALDAKIDAAYADPIKREAATAKFNASIPGKAALTAEDADATISDLASKPDITDNPAAQITLVDKYIQLATGSTRPGIAQYQKLLGAQTGKDMYDMITGRVAHHPVLGRDQISNIVTSAKTEAESASASYKAFLSRPENKEQAKRLGMLPDDDGSDAGGGSSSAGGHAGSTAQMEPALRALHQDAGKALMSYLGVPVQVTSGRRDASHNAAVGGSPTSEHLSGDAWDFKPQGMSNPQAATKLAETLKSQGIPFDQIEVTPSHVHIGFGPKMRGEIIGEGVSGGGGGKVAGGHVPPGAPTATGPDGKKMYFDGKEWKDA